MAALDFTEGNDPSIRTSESFENNGGNGCFITCGLLNEKYSTKQPNLIIDHYLNIAQPQSD